MTSSVGIVARYPCFERLDSPLFKFKMAAVLLLERRIKKSTVAVPQTIIETVSTIRLPVGRLSNTQKHLANIGIWKANHFGIVSKNLDLGL